MTTKYKKLQPHQLVAIARELASAVGTVVETESRLRADAGQRGKASNTYQAHELKYEAQQLGVAMRALADVGSMLREELFLAASDVKKAARVVRKEAPRCDAMKASGGLCATRLQPGEFRCPLHAAELRDRRIHRTKGAVRSGPSGGAVGSEPERSATSKANRETTSTTKTRKAVSTPLSPETGGPQCARE